MINKQIKIMIVDDSKVARDLLTYIVESDEQLKVVATAEDGEKALQLLKTTAPDVMIVDIVMPNMDGFQLTRKIMETQPLPIIVVSGIYNRDEIKKSFAAISAGALIIIEKPKGYGDNDYLDTARFVIETIKALAEVKFKTGKNVIFTPMASSPPPSTQKPVASTPYVPLYPRPSQDKLTKPIRAIGIGASIGGPQALSAILSQLPQDLPAAIFVVQHISSGFVDGFVSWLSDVTPLKVAIPKAGEIALPGHVYVAPDKFHLEIGKGGIMKLESGGNDKEFPPSIGRLFRSLAKEYGAEAAGILLTGVGKDGVEDLLYMKDNGCMTIVQDEETSVKFDMPREAILLGAAKKILPIQQISMAIKNLTTVQETQKKN